MTIGPEKALGVPLGKHLNDSVFWDALISKIKKKLILWKTSNLSYFGKVHIIKSLGVSTLLYACEMKLIYLFLFIYSSYLPRDPIRVATVLPGVPADMVYNEIMR